VRALDDPQAFILGHRGDHRHETPPHIRDLTKTSGVGLRMPLFGEVWDHLWD
jgi:hypothetical protein